MFCASTLVVVAALADHGAMRARVASIRACMDTLVEELAQRGIAAVATQASFVVVKLSSPLQPWAAGLAARRILVGVGGHVGPMADWIRVTVTSREEIDTFLEALDVLRAQGVGGATEVRGVEGSWDRLDDEGMA